MIPLRIAIGATIVAAFAAGPAAAQTVADYRQSLNDAAVLDTTPDKAAVLCRPVSNYAAVMIPEARSDVSTIVSAISFAAPPQDALVQKRAVCMGARGIALIVFDDKSGTPLFTPLKLEDPRKAYGAIQPPAPGQAQPQ
jgi:hypothetical protein